ncbi:MAG: hypothetical protein QOI08_1082 [Actinomycetota bacterium]|jgi:hypothetical protein|nr:hypothetical protein [Actinomycetota bacterium]
MEKLVYLVYERPSVNPAELRKRFLDDVAPQLVALQPHALQMDLDDEHAQMQSMVPVPGDELPVRACVSIWIDAHDERAPYEAVLRAAGVRLAGYLVTESMFREYGDNEHSKPRDWPDGTRSPGIITLTVFDKPQGVDDETFYGHWYSHQSPMSEDMQPRARYVRNAVARAVTPGAPRLRAIVEEAWPSVEHVTNLHRFFGASSNEELGENIRVMLDSTKLLYDPATMRNYPLSEYILKS